MSARDSCRKFFGLAGPKIERLFSLFYSKNLRLRLRYITWQLVFYLFYEELLRKGEYKMGFIWIEIPQ